MRLFPALPLALWAVLASCAAPIKQLPGLPDTYRVRATAGEIRTARGVAVDALRAAPVGDEVGGANGALAIWNPDFDLSTVRVVGVRAGRSVDPNVVVEVATRPNGTNTRYRVLQPYGWLPLALKTNTVGEAGVIGTPYDPAYQNPDVVDSGVAYLYGVLLDAKRHLDTLGVESRWNVGKPVTLDVDLRTLFVINVVEHIDPALAAMHGVPWAVDAVLTRIALDGESAYAHARSRRDAAGLAQFMEDSFESVRTAYPQAALPKGGRLNHLHAAVAQFCYVDDTLRRFANAPQPIPSAQRGPFVAAAYNAGPARVVEALKSRAAVLATDPAAPAWNEGPYGIKAETMRYVRIYNEAFAYLFPSAPDALPAMPERAEAHAGE